MRVTKNKNGSFNVFGLSSGKAFEIIHLLEFTLEAYKDAPSINNRLKKVSPSFLVSETSEKYMTEVLQVLNIIYDL